MGRNELRSSGFIDGFLRRAVTRACFCEQGRKPVCRDALQMVATTGASTSTVRFTSQVGARSRSQCLHGNRVISRCTSSAVTNWNVDRAVDKRSVTHDGRADAVIGTNLVDVSCQVIRTVYNLRCSWRLDNSVDLVLQLPCITRAVCKRCRPVVGCLLVKQTPL